MQRRLYRLAGRRAANVRRDVVDVVFDSTAEDEAIGELGSQGIEPLSLCVLRDGLDDASLCAQISERNDHRDMDKYNYQADILRVAAFTRLPISATGIAQLEACWEDNSYSFGMRRAEVAVVDIHGVNLGGMRCLEE